MIPRVINAKASGLLAIISGVLLALPFLHSSLYLFVWIGLIPLLSALQGKNRLSAYWLGLCCGLVFSALVCYWMPVFILNVKHYSLLTVSLLSFVFWLYCANLFGLISLLYTEAKRRFNVDELLFFPLLFSLLPQLYPLLFPLHLGESQSRFLPAIQATSYLGTSALDYLIVLSNCLLFKWLSEESCSLATTMEKIAVAAFSLWFSYGLYAIWEWEAEINNWPTKNIALVQSTAPPDINVPIPEAGFSRAFPPEFAFNALFSLQNIDLVVWPETRYKGYFNEPHVRTAYQHTIGHSATPLLFQDMEIAHQEGIEKEYNSAALLDHTGKLVGHYRKIMRIPFGEYIPLVNSLPSLRTLAEMIFGKFSKEISPGLEPVIFSMQGLNLIPIICYEAAFPEFVARVSAKKIADKVLVNLSNDSWFGNSRLPHQHLSLSVLRAVENRTTFVQVMNNGPSAVIAANGKRLFQSPSGVNEAYIIGVPVNNDQAISFYSRHPQIFNRLMYLGTLVLITQLLVQYVFRRYREGIESNKNNALTK